MSKDTKTTATDSTINTLVFVLFVIIGLITHKMPLAKKVESSYQAITHISSLVYSLTDFHLLRVQSSVKNNMCYDSELIKRYCKKYFTHGA